MAKNVWYINGLHFACQQCGKCCSGPDEGVIWISKPEINMLAEHLNITPAELGKKYLKRIGFQYSILENPSTKDCVFLTTSLAPKLVLGVKTPTTGVGDKRCTIYNFRPMQCRNWPFWQGNLQSPDDWNAAAVKCPGINKGRFYSFEEIEKSKKQKQRRDTNLKSQISDLRFKVLCNEVKRIYDRLDSETKPFNAECSACGKCCIFDCFGHKLFITTPELLYFRQNVRDLKPMTEKSCPYLENGKCAARDYRFAGCRIFFCRADKNRQSALSEKTVAKFRTICDKYDIPYYYKDLAAVLNNPQ